MLFGMRSPEAGHIAINNVDPRDLRPDALRRAVSLVRDAEIFHGTLAENVHLERPDVSTSDVREALEDVGLIDEVLRLPDGLETELFDNGYPLTRNQACKLMIARAIVGKPRLLLVDSTIDGLPDQDVRRLTSLLVDARQPWTLVLATGRSDVAEAGKQLLDLTHRRPNEKTAPLREITLATSEPVSE
jgi:ABC-type bacteriocin/lantibiotic exporter with double-glycine peptidase domain